MKILMTKDHFLDLRDVHLMIHAPGVKFGHAPGVDSLHRLTMGKKLKNLLL